MLFPFGSSGSNRLLLELCLSVLNYRGKFSITFKLIGRFFSFINKKTNIDQSEFFGEFNPRSSIV